MGKSRHPLNNLYSFQLQANHKPPTILQAVLLRDPVDDDEEGTRVQTNALIKGTLLQHRSIDLKPQLRMQGELVKSQSSRRSRRAAIHYQSERYTLNPLNSEKEEEKERQGVMESLRQLAESMIRKKVAEMEMIKAREAARIQAEHRD
ncbi:hypothetical protein Tco_1036076 [Tanacetum coccineum]